MRGAAAAEEEVGAGEEPGEVEAGAAEEPEEVGAGEEPAEVESDAASDAVATPEGAAVAPGTTCIS